MKRSSNKCMDMCAKTILFGINYVVTTQNRSSFRSLWRRKSGIFHLTKEFASVGILAKNGQK